MLLRFNMLDSSVAIIAGDPLADYHFGDKHAFGPHRHQAFLDGMDRLDLTSQVKWLEPVQCDFHSLQSFHSEEYIKQVKQGSESGWIIYRLPGQWLSRQCLND